MQIRIGTSGYQYKFWRGHFYTEGCKEAAMLAEYGAKLPTVEINNTFYRMPKPEVLERWVGQVPDDFRFAIKASRRITHIQRLKQVEENLGYLLSSVQVMGAKLGCVLFQLPPNLKLDLARLDAFLAALTGSARITLEFRHESWFDDAVYSRLREHRVALCISDEGEGEREVPFVATTDFGYLRLRKETYSDAELSEVARRVKGENWSEAYAYFKHEEGAPVLAARLQSLLAVSGE